MTDKTTPEVHVKPHSYQPSKAEMEELIKIETTPEALALAVLRQVNVREDHNA